MGDISSMHKLRGELDGLNARIALAGQTASDPMPPTLYWPANAAEVQRVARTRALVAYHGAYGRAHQEMAYGLARLASLLVERINDATDASDVAFYVALYSRLHPLQPAIGCFFVQLYAATSFNRNALTRYGYALGIPTSLLSAMTDPGTERPRIRLQPAIYDDEVQNELLSTMLSTYAMYYRKAAGYFADGDPHAVLTRCTARFFAHVRTLLVRLRPASQADRREWIITLLGHLSGDDRSDAEPMLSMQNDLICPTVLLPLLSAASVAEDEMVNEVLVSPAVPAELARHSICMLLADACVSLQC